jgi:fermentation-respiration switch protein FrsA (DUF1100 family)
VRVQIAARHDIGAIALEAPLHDNRGYRCTNLLVASRAFADAGPIQIRRLRHRLNAPLLTTHGDADQVIPVDLGKRLFAAVVGPRN